MPARCQKIGDLYEPAMHVQTKEEATLYLARLVRLTMQRFGMEKHEAEDLERRSLGYYASHQKPEVKERVTELFGCAKPDADSILLVSDETELKITKDIGRIAQW